MTGKRTISIVTGNRAEYGLLETVMRAVDEHDELDLEVLVTGTHLLNPARTIDEVAESFDIAGTIRMQEEGATGRQADAGALGRGVSGFATRFAAVRPEVVLVLGDRIEAFAAAAAAAVAGIHLAHMHGGDRAEGIADESIRHAITKLAHLHLPATQQSAQRIISMGEEPARVHIVGSPAIDGLADIQPMPDDEYRRLERPEIIFLLHPSGRSVIRETKDARRLLESCIQFGRTLALHPNHDPNREGILQAVEASPCPQAAHLRRSRFIGLLRRAKVIVGNSSAGLIECAALGLPCVNVGSRQAGREMPGNVIDIPDWNWTEIEAAIPRALRQEPITDSQHPYGDGRCGRRTARLLAEADLESIAVTKRNTY